MASRNLRLTLRACCVTSQDVLDAAYLWSLTMFERDGIRYDRAKLRLYDRKLKESLQAFTEDIHVPDLDREILCSLISHLQGKELQFSGRPNHTERLLDFVHKLLDDHALRDRLVKKYGDIKEQRLQSLAMHLSRQCNSSPQSFFIVASNVGRIPDRIGSGTDVYQCTLQRGRKVALKRLRYFLNMPKFEKERLEGTLSREVLLWTQLRHPNIVPILGMDKANFRRMPSLILPWMQNGNILQYRKNLPSQPTISKLDEWITQIASGMSYLHDQGIVHGDLRSANILISSDGSTACVTDFGLTIFARVHTREYYSWRDNSERWQSPELLDPTIESNDYNVCSYAADVYAFALVCIELYTGDVPFAECKLAHVRKTVLKGGRPSRPSRPTMSTDLWVLVQWCWSHNPNERPSMMDVTKALNKLRAG